MSTFKVEAVQMATGAERVFNVLARTVYEAFSKVERKGEFWAVNATLAK